MMHTQSLWQFLQQTVLPALFERLDRAFPEFAWTRTPLGWKGNRPLNNGNSATGAPVVCNHPWGFVDEQGKVTGWLNYAMPSSGGDLVHTVRSLAGRAAVDDSQLNGISPAEVHDAIAAVRRQELLEQFVAHCNHLLRSSDRHELLHALQSRHGIDTKRIQQLGIGIFSSIQESGDRLVHAGFTQDEIIDAAIVGDARVRERLVVPWRDRHGQLKTIIARDVTGRHPDLYLRSGTKTAAFGLDVALRSDAGGQDHLVIVEDVLDVLFFQSMGVLNVAAVTNFDEAINGWQWEKLAGAGVRSVTLAIASDGANREKIVDSVKATHHVQRSPQVYALAPGALVQCSTSADYVRRYGLPDFQNVLKRREHGYRLVAASIVDKYRKEGSWTEVQLLNMLGEAVRFDAEVDDAARVDQLKQHYWPAILEATGLPWEALRNLVRDRQKPEQLADLGSWHVSNLKQLVQDLEEALRVEDYVTFKRLVCDAAREFGAAVTTAPHVVFETPVQHWTVDESKSRGFIPLATAASRYPVVNIETRRRQQPAVQPRAVPQPVTIHPADIRQLAYHLWEKSGRPTGLDQRFWYEAEKALAANSHPDPANLRVVA